MVTDCTVCKLAVRPSIFTKFVQFDTVSAPSTRITEAKPSSVYGDRKSRFFKVREANLWGLNDARL